MKETRMSIATDMEAFASAMSIAEELEAFASTPGYKCRIGELLPAFPAEHTDLMEAFASPVSHSAVARWWNATRAARTGTEVSENMISRHRRKECRKCR
jgi:hypothetical protein